MTDFETIIKTRRSIREYTDDEVEDAKIEQILKSGMQAPGSRLGSEPWEFIVIKNKETLQKIGEVKPRVKDAPVAIVVLANIDRAFYKTVWQQDCGAAIENMLLEAVNQGLGGLWNGVSTYDEIEKAVKEILGITNENIRVYSIVTLGYPAEGQENKFMDKYDESRVFYETYPE
ncbi:nitroreductase family protein [Methanosphaera sp.]